MKHSTPLRRSKGVKKRRATPRRSGRVLDPEFLAVVRTLRCYVCGRPGPNDPDHMGPRPYGRKADDTTAVPMCPTFIGRNCHRYRTDGFIPDGGHAWCAPVWVRASKWQMREFCDRAIAATRAVVLPMLGREVE